MFNILLRIFLLFVVIALGAFTALPTHTFVIDSLRFENPSDFFGSSWADWSLAWILASLFWGGIVFGVSGKKIDYFFTLLLSVIGFLGFVYTKNVMPLMYLGLVGVAVLGNVLGYMLKVGRQNWFGR